ncbi:Eukaryotic translation initiation factor 2 subunit 1 [Cucumispora dikerogammari]|nr:Eukaryotic translation initiation factor 2 subunit 1 [Cucumispora dikerogammari]
MFNEYPLKQNLPTPNDLVICKYISNTDYTTTLTLLEYNLPANLTTENIKDLKKKKMFVCSVKSVKEFSNGVPLIELSENISEEESKTAIDTFIENKISHNILISLSKRTNIPIKDIYEDFAWKQIEKFGTLKIFFNELLNGLEFNEKYKNELIKLIKQKNKSANIKIRASVVIKSPLGVEGLRGCLEKMLLSNKEIEIHFVSSPNYEVSLKGEELDELKLNLNRVLEVGKEYILEKGGELDIISLDVISK